VGPGDPDLLTLKASRVLERVPVVCLRQPEPGRENYALDVVQQFLDESRQEILRLPLPPDDSPGAARSWNAAVDSIVERLQLGKDVAFITEGDPMLYSSFCYLMEKMRASHPEAPVEVIPGVSSVMAAAASAGVPLVTHGQRLAILPAVYGIDDLREAITNYDTIVLMQVNRTLLEALANLEKLGLAGKAIYVRRATTQREEVVQGIHQVSEEDFDYFSLLIIKR
jgi:precorrin-2/cobalt-factor-2 C20-methyltransferase|tara:strand:- start:339 stop:1013 length:675 start_codon:yes stop_codon:yes gene_type:complete